MGNTDDVLIIRERIDKNLNILSESPTSDLSIKSDMGQHWQSCDVYLIESVPLIKQCLCMLLQQTKIRKV